MYFKRFFRNGEVTQTRFAVFYCGVCKKEHYFEARKENYDISPRPCPDCKSIDVNDHRNQLIQKRDRLVQQITELQAELDTINVELITTEEQIHEEQKV